MIKKHEKKHFIKKSYKYKPGQVRAGLGTETKAPKCSITRAPKMLC